MMIQYAVMLETADKLLADEFDVDGEVVALVRRYGSNS